MALSRVRIVLDGGTTLPPHLMDQLQEWHRQNPSKQPPGSYRSANMPLDERKVFSRTGEDITDLLKGVLVLQPVEYRMLVLHRGEQATFVGCIKMGRWRTFFKGWLGMNEFEPKACAVWISSSARPFLALREDMFEAADCKLPYRKTCDDASPATDTSPDGDGSSITSSDRTSTTSAVGKSLGQQHSLIKIGQSPSTTNDDKAATIVFNLTVPKSPEQRFAAQRCFRVKITDTGRDLFEKIRQFFTLFGCNRMAQPIFICKGNWGEALRYIFDAEELQFLLDDLRVQARNKEGNLTVDFAPSTAAAILG